MKEKKNQLHFMGSEIGQSQKRVTRINSAKLSNLLMQSLKLAISLRPVRSSSDVLANFMIFSSFFLHR